jgi:hypothetical protein
LLEKDPKSREGLDDWKRAAEYYALSVADELAKTDSATINEKSVGQAGERLWSFALEFNGVPEDVQSFVQGDERPAREPLYFEKAAEVFEALGTGSEARTILRARCYGFLGRFADAAAVFDTLFAEARFVESTQGAPPRINSKVVQARPRLLSAFLDWAVADLLAGVADKQPDRFGRASDRLRLLLTVTTSESPLWWGAKYYQMRTLFETGKFQDAALLMNDLERNTEEASWSKYGYRDKIVKLRDKLIELGHKKK